MRVRTRRFETIIIKESFVMSVYDNWREIRSKVENWWPELSKEELDVLGNGYEQLVFLLQKKGYTLEEAQLEFHRKVAEDAVSVAEHTGKSVIHEEARVEPESTERPKLRVDYTKSKNKKRP